ncbi:MAG: biliverdin-producing heme oxygenase [Deltaproteobacteria bacterium]|nr:biliverdin-producing heme oxygenase [Deltaproteobacteria bacterium]
MTRMVADLRMLQRLNAETEGHHGEADADLDRYVFRDDVTRTHYRTYLARLYGFIVPLEHALQHTPGLDDIIDLQARSKSATLLYDLLALGMTLQDVAELPQCLSIPAFKGPAAALGWMYVAERPMLQAAVIRSHLEAHLGGNLSAAMAYLSSYSGQCGQRWRELGEAMDRVGASGVLADRITTAANEAFRCLLRWKTQDVSRSHIRAAV